MEMEMIEIDAVVCVGGRIDEKMTYEKTVQEKNKNKNKNKNEDKDEDDDDEDLMKKNSIERVVYV